MKKFLSAILVSTILCCSMGALAADNTTPLELPESTATLIDENNNQREVKGVLVETSPMAMNSGAGYALTYAYPLDLERGFSGSQNINSLDSANTLTAYSTIYYLVDDAVTPEQYLMTTVSGSWQIRDSATTVTNCFVNYGCNGLYKSRMYMNTQLGSSDHLGNNFTLATGFTQGVAMLGGTIGANMKLTIQKGGNTWTLNMANSYIN